MKIEAFFENISNEIKSELEKATDSIEIALAYFTDLDLFNVLCNKAIEGLKIELIISSEEINHAESTLDFHTLTKSGVSCMYINNERGLMHHKFCLIDKSVLITGSYNWTYNAANINYENILIIRENKEIADKYHNEFEAMKINADLRQLHDFRFLQFADISEQSKISYSRNNFLSGFDLIDKNLHGLQSKNIYTLVSRTANGSSTFAINLAQNLILNDTKVAFFSIDLNEVTFIKRFISKILEIPINEIDNQENKESIDKAFKNEKLQNLFIDFTPDLTLKDIEISLLALKNKSVLDVVIIDSIDQIRIERKINYFTNKTQKEFEYEIITREIKRISRALDIPIFLVLKCGNKSDGKNYLSPYISDLPNAISQYSNTIIALRRQEIYGITEDEEGNSLIGMAELALIKSPNGELESQHIRFDKTNLTFSNLIDENEIFS